MYNSEAAGGDQLALFSRRRYSMSPTGRFLVLGSLAAVTLGISLGFALNGAWPLLPFAGIECVALYLAFRWLQRHEDDYEFLTIEDQSLTVESCVGGTVERRSLNRAWAQVVVESQPQGRVRLLLRSHGRDTEVGKLLSNEGKLTAAARIRERLSARALTIKD